MTPTAIFISFLVYTVMLFTISFITSRKADNEAYFLGNRQSPWYVVAYGMIGASLSGVTFISIPGDVGSTKFSYMMIVAGYLVGYYVIANVLLPVYYKLNLTSIYTYLENRFGFWSYKTGAFFFLVSRLIGASFRMFLVVNVLQIFVFDVWELPFWMTVSAFMILMIIYTFRGGIKTIVWTDTLQTTFMLLTVIVSILLIKDNLGLDFNEFIQTLSASEYTQMINVDWTAKTHYLKQFFSGAFIAIVMTGLDQDMMQKNLSCRNLKEAKKNVYWMSASLVPVNFLILTLGASLFIFAQAKGIEIPNRSDNLFPIIALKHLMPFAGIVFMIGLISAAYSSADSALTSLTTSFTVDFLGIRKRTDLSSRQKTRLRYFVHVVVAIIIVAIIIVFRAINDQSVISRLFTIAGYTYGPLLGMFAFGLFTRMKSRDPAIPILAILSPVISYVISVNSQDWFWGYKFGFELLIVNGLIMFLGLWILHLFNK
ncbi:MAG: sodium:solute symporter [Bacteroidales bacterium]|nr:sodium:solute symporter [Bacteroidales bacterium]MCF8333021.1 sodium:solute symporter [Bacteroidales bacterium]